MTRNGRSADARQSREKPGARNTSPERDRPSPALESSTHPILALQRAAGNRAVQRALGHDPWPAHRATHIQRHVAPGTVALGQMLSASLLGHFADLTLQNMELQQTASEVGATADGVLNDNTDFIVYSVSAETYDADSDSATQVTPATETTPTTIDVREPLVIQGSDSPSAQ